MKTHISVQLICFTVSKFKVCVSRTSLLPRPVCSEVNGGKKCLISLNCNRCASDRFSVNITSTLYFYGFPGLEKHASHAGSALESEIRRGASKQAEKSPVEHRKQTAFICGVDKRLFPVQRRKYVEGAKKSGAASIPAPAAKQRSTLMKPRRMCVYPPTTNQHECGPNGDRKSPGVYLRASVFIEEMLCTLQYRLFSPQIAPLLVLLIPFQLSHKTSFSAASAEI